VGKGLRILDPPRVYPSIGRRSARRDLAPRLKKDLIWSPRLGYVDFTVPHFAQYIQGHHSLDEFEA
jgi:hypothetical protein